MAKQMGCTDCDKNLSLTNIVDEVRHGFASTLTIDCECGTINNITTGKSHRVSKRGPAVFDINSKAALGMIHSGSGHTQVINFMSSLEIEGLHHKTMKKREREVETSVQTVAMQSCKDAIAKEIELEKEISHTLGEMNDTPGQFKYDMGWQKRGSGRAYDSKSGVGTLIGSRSGKICAYGIRSKVCRKCSFHNNQGQIPPKHECKKNWAGSSKAMESNVAIEVINQVEEENIQVSVLIMARMARINENISHPVEKWSDIKHARKHLGNSLYDLMKKHTKITTKCVQFIQKCFSYALAQNKDDPIGLKKTLNQIVMHAFGEHENCDPTWCGYLQNPDSYKHKSLPYGHDLSGKELRHDINIALQPFIHNADKLCHGGSTKEFESFNNAIASKAPKRIHYSSTSSLHNRVNCAVAEKNIGSGYVNMVNSLVGLSPGRIVMKHALKKDNTRKRRNLYENTRDFKKRKLERKLNKCNSESQSRVREGVTYQPSVDLMPISTEAVTEIPSQSITPVVTRIQVPESFSTVYCDIETTSLSKHCDIVQIAAASDGDIFNQYTLPSQSIAPQASAVTGIKMHGHVLHYNDNPVQTVSLKEALSLFLIWLDTRKPCVFVGHNFKIFDFPRITRSFDKCQLLSPLLNTLIGIVDTLPLFRELYPDLRKYNQEYLINQILNKEYSAHNAVEDVLSLQELVSQTKPATNVFVHHSVTADSMIDIYHFYNKGEENFKTLFPLHESKLITKQMCLKIARSGLRLENLKLAYNRGGLKQVLSEKDSGKPRVTSTKRIIDIITNCFDK